MNIREFQKVVRIAKDGKPFAQDVIDAAWKTLDGFGLPEFQPVVVRPEVAAYVVRWQCRLLNGGWDDYAMDDCWRFFRRKVQLV